MNFDRLRSLLLEQAIRGELVEQQAIDFAVPGKLFKNPCYQAGWNKNVPFSFS